MSERAYTVKELDALRECCRTKWMYGYCTMEAVCANRAQGRSYKETELIQCVEELVRTHMLAGHTAQDLYASEQPTDGASHD